MNSRPQRHIPVLSNEILEYLQPQQNETILDCTVGLGGHAKQILASVNSTITYIALDQDIEALALAKENLKDYSNMVTFVHCNFRELDDALDSLNIKEVDKVLFDLGVSSLQLDEAERGFSFGKEGPLDMRMNQDEQQKAKDVLNQMSVNELTRILEEYGEEKFSRKIAKAIVERRKLKQFETTHDLVDTILELAGGSRSKKYKIHPATRTFQALRIYVNDELNALKEGLNSAIERLKPDGRIAVISFHSLEDRIVKHVFRDMKLTKEYKVLTKKPIIAAWEEKKSNPRARSAKLRVLERLERC